MIITIFKSTALPWILKWPPLLLTFFRVISKQTLWKMFHFNPTLRCDISMIFLQSGLKVQITLKIFIDYFKNVRSTIKFASSHSSTNIPFLDVSVSLTNDGSISTDLYTERHQHLLYSSCHPLHTEKKPLLAVQHSAYDIYIQPTLRLILALFNLQLTILNEVTTITSSGNKYDASPTSPVDLLYKPKTSINLNVYYLLLHLIHHSLTSLTLSKNITFCCSLLTAAKQISAFTCSCLQNLTQPS